MKFEITKALDYLLTDTHHLIVAEQDVIEALKVINEQHRFVPDLKVANCGWADGYEKEWFIHFRTSRIRWQRIKRQLNLKRVFENGEIPKAHVGVIYTTD